MQAGTPLRYRLLEAVAESLRKIAIGNGYYTDLYEVVVGWRNPTQILRYPLVCVTQGTGSTRPRTLHQVKHEHYMRVEVHAFVSGNAEVSRELALASIEEDIYRRLVEDAEDLGGLLVPGSKGTVGVEEAEPDEIYDVEGLNPAQIAELVKVFTIRAYEDV